jgi:hypothetical protein
LSSQADLGQIDREASTRPQLAAVRLLLPMGWLLTAIGYYGPWVLHKTAALTLSGVDMGEFVKFLPGVVDGSLAVIRQFFYLPPFATVASVALLVGAQRLRYPRFVRALALALSLPVSLQLLPPAWSPASLVTPEFRLQTLALGLSWLLLAAFWLLGRLPAWLSGMLSAALSLVAALVGTWQFLLVKPAIDQVYRSAPDIGWGFFACISGLLLMTGIEIQFVLRTRRRRGGTWSGP